MVIVQNGHGILTDVLLQKLKLIMISSIGAANILIIMKNAGRTKKSTDRYMDAIYPLKV